MLYVVKEWKAWEMNWYKTYKQGKKSISNGHQNQAICHKKYLTMIYLQ